MFGGENNKKLFVMICIGIIIWLSYQFYNIYNENRFDENIERTHESSEIQLAMDDVVVNKSSEKVQTYNESDYSILKLKKSEVKEHLISYGSLIFITNEDSLTINLYELEDTYLDESYANIRTQFIDKHVVGKLNGIYFLLDDELLRLVK
jgi:hypothetical protein